MKFCEALSNLNPSTFFAINYSLGHYEIRSPTLSNSMGTAFFNYRVIKDLTQIVKKKKLKYLLASLSKAIVNNFLE